MLTITNHQSLLCIQLISCLLIMNVRNLPCVLRYLYSNTFQFQLLLGAICWQRSKLEIVCNSLYMNHILQSWLWGCSTCPKCDQSSLSVCLLYMRLPTRYHGAWPKTLPLLKGSPFPHNLGLIIPWEQGKESSLWPPINYASQIQLLKL